MQALLSKALLLHSSLSASTHQIEEIYQQVLKVDPINVEALCNYGLHLYVSACMYLRVCICVYVSACMYTYVSTYICDCIYVYT